MNLHEFKKGRNTFRWIWNGQTAEVYQERYGDIQAGDWMSLKEYVPANDEFTGRAISCEVTEVIPLGQFALIRFAPDIVRVADIGDNVVCSHEDHIFIL